MEHDPNGLAAFRAAEQIIEQFDLPNTWHATETLREIILSATLPPPKYPSHADYLKYNCAHEAAGLLMQVFDDDDLTPRKLFERAVVIIGGAIAEFRSRGTFDTPKPSRN